MCKVSHLLLNVAITTDGLEAASLAVVPPHLTVGEGCVVIGGAPVSTVVPFGSQIRTQGLQRVADADLAARTIRTSCRVGNSCTPSVGLPFRTLIANPVSLDSAHASDFAGIQACHVIQLPVPASLDAGSLSGRDDACEAAYASP